MNLKNDKIKNNKTKKYYNIIFLILIGILMSIILGKLLTIINEYNIAEKVKKSESGIMYFNI